MTEHDYGTRAVDQFLRDQIDTVPHLEALLLLWNSRPKPWSIEDMAKGLFLAKEAAQEILCDLVRRLTRHHQAAHTHGQDGDCSKKDRQCQ